jgi:glucuronate isomerase
MATDNKHIVIFKNDTITLTHHEIQGYWLHDKTQGMNLSMRAKTEQEAFIQALTYYQKSYADATKKLKDITNKVDSFLDKFRDDEEMRPENY